MSHTIKIASVLAVALLMFVALVPGCSRETATQTTTATTTTTTTTATTTKPAQTFVMRYAEMTPNNQARTDALEWWGKEIEKRTDGQLKVEFYWAGSLVKSTEILNAVSTGIADAGLIHGAIFPDKVPMLSIANILFNFDSMLQGLKAIDYMYENDPAFKQELDKLNVRYLFPQASQAWQLQFKTPVKTLADMKGQKIAFMGYGLADIFSKAGLIPTSITATEVKVALDRGTVDAWASEPHIFDSYGTASGAPYVVWADLGGFAGWPGGINKDFWNKLPADVQQVVTEVSKEFIDVFYDLRMKEAAGSIDMLRTKYGMKFTKLPDAERDQWKQQSQAVFDQWAKDQDAKGLPGTEVARAWREALKKFPSTQTVGVPTTWDY